jgi:hypothetical protein
MRRTRARKAPRAASREIPIQDSGNALRRRSQDEELMMDQVALQKLLIQQPR